MKFSRLAAAALALLSLATPARGQCPSVCRAKDQCHTPGLCDPRTGKCTNPEAFDGFSCNDRNLCTVFDFCLHGICTGHQISCPSPPNQCHNPGVCNSDTGRCSNSTMKPNGSACNDGNACTQNDSCQNGICTGTNPVVCAVPDQCHEPGTCNPSTGQCSNPIKPNDSGCNDGNVCTQTDICQNGTCTGTNPVVCAAPDQCHQPGTCDPITGKCSNPMKPSGLPCNDGNPFTLNDRCIIGFCSGESIRCPILGKCYNSGRCNSDTGRCSNSTMKPNGSACNDGNACTQTDICQDGNCTGTPVVCTAQDEFHVAGTCNPTTGQCSSVLKNDGGIGSGSTFDSKPCPLPTVNLTNSTIVEGSSVNISFTSESPVYADVDWGDGSIMNSGTQVSFTHKYQNDGNYTIKTNYNDTPGCVGHKEFYLTVVNAAPVLTLVPMKIIPYTVIASIQCCDSGVLDGQTIHVYWNDGSEGSRNVTRPTPVQCNDLVFTHNYFKAGTYNISAIATDNGGASSNVASSKVTFSRWLRGVDGIPKDHSAGTHTLHLKEQTE